MDPSFTIVRMRLRQYRSIARCDVNLGALALLVGPNGSGKSNFLGSLRLTSQALLENLDNALRERGGIGEVRRRSNGHPTHFGIKINFRANDLSGSYAYEVGAMKGGDFRVSKEECHVSAATFGSRERFFKVRDGTLVGTSEAIMPPVSSDRLYLVAAAGLEAFRLPFDGLAAVNVYNLNPDAMRQLQPPDAGDLLRRDGSNVASVLERLRREDPVVKQRIEDYLERVVAGISGVDRRGYGAWDALEFRQAVAGGSAPWTFQATSMSDGTLRTLGVLVALLGGSSSLLSPVGIEEPEVALHPAAAGLLLDALRDAAETRQVLVTTHSPDLLDSPEITASDLLAVRAKDGVTTIGRVDRAGQQALRGSLFTAGELLRADQLTPEPESASQLELFG